MDGSHAIKLFRQDGRQAVDIPAELELPGEDAIIRREGDRLIIETQPTMITGAEFAAFLRTLEPIDDEIGEIEDLPPRPFSL